MRTPHLKISIVLFLIGIFLNGCTTTSEKHIQGQLQELSFTGVKFVDGKFKAQPGFHFEIDKNTGRTLLMRQDGGDPVAAMSCAPCVLPPGSAGGGFCDKATIVDPDNDDAVIEAWCTGGCSAGGGCTGVLDSIDGNLSLKVNFVSDSSGGKCR